MTENSAQKDVVQLLERVSGKPVLVHADSSLAFHATIRMASENAPAHVLRYKPDYEPEIPYLVCFQCGFAIRSFQLPANERFNIVPTEKAHACMGQLIDQKFRNKKPSIPAPVIDGLKQQMVNGLGTQLRSIPIGMRVDEWLFEEYPQLHKMQRIAAIRQINEGAAALAPSIRDISPKKVLETSLSMNAAFATFWSRLWADETVVTPYKLSGYFGKGQSLLATLDELSSAPGCDRELVMLWMKRLALEDWYKCIPWK